MDRKKVENKKGKQSRCKPINKNSLRMAERVGFEPTERRKALS